MPPQNGLAWFSATFPGTRYQGKKEDQCTVRTSPAKLLLLPVRNCSRGPWCARCLHGFLQVREIHFDQAAQLRYCLRELLRSDLVALPVRATGERAGHPLAFHDRSDPLANGFRRWFAVFTKRAVTAQSAQNRRILLLDGLGLGNQAGVRAGCLFERA